jgi:ribonucleotide reductase alpha subunit
MDEGYQVVAEYDKKYSEWLGIRESIKMTTIKPSGTVSLLAGESAGVHWDVAGRYQMRLITFADNDPMLPLFKMANYRVEESVYTKGSSVVYFPIKSNSVRSAKDVSIYEKIALAATAQRYWSDNSVSVTVSFDPEKESEDVGRVLHMYDGQLKTVSFLPSGNMVYAQMPYQEITEEEYNAYSDQLFPIDFIGVYEGLGVDAIGEAYCTTDACEIKLVKDNQ